MNPVWLVPIVVSYLVGSIPFALLAGKLLKGVDIRRVGSGNVGATNALRALGPGPSFVVLLLDFAKGALPTWMAWQLTGSLAVAILAAMAAIAGHNWSLYIRFQGGKGVATGLGTLSVLLPPAALLATLLGIGLIALTRYVSLGSVTGAVVVPILAIGLAFLGAPVELVPYTIICSLVVIIQHRANIGRLLAGKEHRIFEHAGGSH
jgi:glycerol-3-phosphate acyltransferase PlsY